MKHKIIKATSLRSIMIIALLLTLALVGVGFYFAQEELTTFSDTVISAMSRSKTGITSAQGLESIEKALSARSVDIAKADMITPTSADYQSQAIKDLTIYASKTNVTITDYSVVESSVIGVTPLTIEGVKTEYIKLTFGEAIDFNDFIKFLQLVETNTPKMQVTGIEISQANDKKIEVAPLIIELYTEL